MADPTLDEDNPDRRLLKLVEATMKRPVSSRDAYLREQVGSDSALHRSVMKMIAMYEQTSSIMPESPLEQVTVGPAPDHDESQTWSSFLTRLRHLGPSSERFRDDGEVARGGMGAIHRVRDENLRRTLAMKILLSSGGEDSSRTASALGRFLEEAQVTSQLDHPGIVPVQDVGLDRESNVYFTMKFVKGEDLRSVFARVHDPADPWTETRALTTLLKVCEAMSYAHEKGVIHRDLKPANIMVGRHGETYVMDWGLAKVLSDDHRKPTEDQPAETSGLLGSERRDASDKAPDSPLVTMEGDIVGTPAYMAPEQALGRVDEVGPHSDVYSFGAILYHLITGQVPYSEANDRISARMTLARVQAGPPRRIAEIRPTAPADLVAICERAMARNIGERHPSMSALADEIRGTFEHDIRRSKATLQRSRLLFATQLFLWLAFCATIGVAVFTFADDITVHGLAGPVDYQLRFFVSGTPRFSQLSLPIGDPETSTFGDPTLSKINGALSLPVVSWPLSLAYRACLILAALSVIAFLFQLRWLLKAAQGGRPFAAENATRLRKMGAAVLLLGSILFADEVLLPWIISSRLDIQDFTVTVTTDSMNSQHHYGTVFVGSAYFAVLLFFGVCFFVFAEVFRLGTALEEQSAGE